MAKSDDQGAGRKASDRGTSQFSESGSRKEVEHNRGERARGLTDAQHESGQEAHESSTRSREVKKSSAR